MSFTLRELNLYRGPSAERTFTNLDIVNPKADEPVVVVRPPSDIRDRLIAKWEALQEAKRGATSIVTHVPPCKYPVGNCIGCGTKKPLIQLTDGTEVKKPYSYDVTPISGLLKTNDPCPNGCGVLLRYDNILEGNICIRCRSIFRPERKESNVVTLDQAQRAKAEAAAGAERFRALIESTDEGSPVIMVDEEGRACYHVYDREQGKMVPADKSSWGYHMTDD